MFVHVAWWISMEIRQPQGSLVSVDVNVLPSINVSRHLTEQIEEDMFRLVTAKNQGSLLWASGTNGNYV